MVIVIFIFTWALHLKSETFAEAAILGFFVKSLNEKSRSNSWKMLVKELNFNDDHKRANFLS